VRPVFNTVDRDTEYVEHMRRQAAEHITIALNGLYNAQRAIRELTNPGPAQDPAWAESGQGAAGISLLAQSIDMAWALRAIAENINDGRIS
jgi:hypothetical protein